MAIFRSPWANALKVGNVAPGAKLYFFEVGTSTPKAVQDAEGGDDHAHPVVADSNGIFPLIYGTGAYKVRLDDANDAVLASIASYTFETSVESFEGTLTAPSGTKMLFYGSPPTGWTKDTDVTNSMVVITSGTAGSSGGSVSAISYSQDLSHTHTTSSHALTEAEMPSHYHVQGSYSGSPDYSQTTVASGSRDAYAGTVTQTLADRTDTAGSGDAHTHGDTGSASLTASWAPKYSLVNKATKD